MLSDNIIPGDPTSEAAITEETYGSEYVTDCEASVCGQGCPTVQDCTHAPNGETYAEAAEYRDDWDAWVRVTTEQDEASWTREVWE